MTTRTTAAQAAGAHPGENADPTVADGGGRHVATWDVEASGGGLETSWVRLGAGRLAAQGRAVGLDPAPYWLTYRLRTGSDWVTQELAVEVEDAAGSRQLVLRRHPDGTWTANGDPVEAVRGALDCDLARSPLTNTMPILRHRLHERPGVQDLVMAWVAVPELTVHRSGQRYEHLRRDPDGAATVRYANEQRSFTADLTVEPSGLVHRYPRLAARRGAGPGATGTGTGGTGT